MLRSNVERSSDRQCAKAKILDAIPKTISRGLICQMQLLPPGLYTKAQVDLGTSKVETMANKTKYRGGRGWVIDGVQS